MSKKHRERSLVMPLPDTEGRSPKYNFGTKSNTDGTNYVDPNEEGWQKLFLKQAKLQREKNELDQAS
jgi:hypothetical protein